MMLGFFSKYVKILSLAGVVLAGVGVYFLFPRAPQEIHFRHSLMGFLEETLIKVVDDFNKTSSCKIILEYGGNYTESFNNTFKVSDHSKRPHLLMVSEYNTPTMYNQKDDYVPLYKLIDIEAARFVPVIKEFYSFKESDEGKAHLCSLPFNCSTAILFYNKDIFKKAGLPDKAPETWEEMEVYAEKLRQAGYTAFTTAWPAAYLLEHFSVVHNIPYATHKNGFYGKNPKLLINTKPFVDQLNKFVEWGKKGFYVYAGRIAEKAEEKFIKQECAMLLQGANRLGYVKDKGFDVGFGVYPYWAKMVPNGPYALNIGGTSIWVLNGHPSYKGVIEFISYLASEKVQQRWHETTGYLPATVGAYERTKSGHHYMENPASKIAVDQVIERENHDLPNGVRVPNYAMARERIINAIDEVLSKQTGFYAKNPAAYMAVAQVVERTNQDLPNGVRITNYGPAREKIIDSIESVLNEKKPAEEALNLAAEEAQLIIDQK
ncbi:MAG: extracellular solute-binding protein [Alphaproteobacteria bacterium]|nr:extracellular solute-binding protein [Alphaproteobacteria bacterium]